jgi:ketosteroid isomerase-like protein
MPRRVPSRRFLVVPLLVAIAAGPDPATAAAAEKRAPPPDVAAFAEAERAFARDAAARGIQPAFLTHLAPDAIVFRPGPVDAHAWLRDHPGSAEARLEWEPTYVEASSGGDLGWTTGPWAFRRATGETPVAYGHYVTVWRRQPDGALRAVIDAGHDHPLGKPEALTWARVGDPSRKALEGPAREEAERALFAAEHAYAEAIVRDGYARALAAHGDKDPRVARNGKPPLRGTSDAGRALGRQWRHAVLAWSDPRGGVSAAGDLGYTYGTVAPAGEERQAFLHVWRNRDGRRWRLALDLMTPAPDPKPGP